jgi:hypothetical protein
VLNVTGQRQILAAVVNAGCVFDGGACLACTFLRRVRCTTWWLVVTAHNACMLFQLQLAVAVLRLPHGQLAAGVCIVPVSSLTALSVWPQPCACFCILLDTLF